MAETTDDNSYVTFLPQEDPPGLEIIDEIQRRRYSIQSETPVTPTRADPDQFHFPVTKAVSVATSSLSLSRVVGVYIRDETQRMEGQVTWQDTSSVGEGRYTLELATQIKTYIRVNGPVEISAGTEETCIEFQEESDVIIGARSRHKRPAATITTTENPHDMMRAIEAFGSALKTADPERSYPTLRGHPPAVELGDELSIPDGLEPPETGITLELPPERSILYVAAPLAFYLGAEIVPSEVPRLTTETGFEYKFDTEGFEADVERVLKQVFFFDCVTRTEGHYEIDLHERNKIESRTNFDFAALYESPLAEQVESYLGVPFNSIEDIVPDWRLTVSVEPESETIEQISFTLNDLAIIRISKKAGQNEAASDPELPRKLTRGEQVTRSAQTTGDATNQRYIKPESSDSLEQAWIGDRVPIGASKLTKEAFQNNFERERSNDSISITVVMNEPQMDREQTVVGEVYGDREDLPFEVELYQNLTVSQLKERLYERTEFLHYVGHTTTEGLECADGRLDVDTLEKTNVDAFLLNSCNSYHQGLSLVEAGAIGGVVTLSDVLNEGAVRVGEVIARLLNAGFPLRAALTIARDETFLGDQYIVVGHGGTTVSQPQSRAPSLLELAKAPAGIDVGITTYPTDDAGMGSLFMSLAEEEKIYRLISGDTGEFTLTQHELSELFQRETLPIRIDGDLYWSDELDLNEVFDE